MSDLARRPHGGELVRAELTEAERRLRELVVNSVSSPASRRTYGKAVDDYLAWAAEAATRDGRPRRFVRASVQEYRSVLEERGLAAATINVRLAPLRKLAAEASANGLLDAAVADAIARVPGRPRLGVRLGRWATLEQASALLAAPDTETLRGKRDRAILAVLVGCALRRSELSSLRVTDLQEREGRAVFADIKGKGGRVRTVPVPGWVEEGLRDWISAAELSFGRIFRSIDREGRLGEGLSDVAVLLVAKHHAAVVGLDLGPHDLRRTCAKLCRAAGGKLEQIQLLLGHASIGTTERYLGTTQELAVAVNDGIKLSTSSAGEEQELDEDDQE